MSETVLLVAELRKVAKELDATMRECTALLCSIVVGAGVPGLDTPEKVVTACKLVHDEIIKQLREEKKH